MSKELCNSQTSVHKRLCWRPADPDFRRDFLKSYWPAVLSSVDICGSVRRVFFSCASVYVVLTALGPRLLAPCASPRAPIDSQCRCLVIVMDASVICADGSILMTSGPLRRSLRVPSTCNIS